MKERFKDIIKNAKSIVFMTGAGISTASGIPDFRSETGIYNQKYRYSPEYMLSHDCFESHPEMFFEFYREKMIYQDAKPNLAHLAIAHLESLGKDVTVVTQNIDGLHQDASSSNVLELHGSVRRNYCQRCNKLFDEKYIINSQGIPRCDKCKQIVKPDVVLYGEGLDNDILSKSINAISEADVLIVVGTSLNVNPAASLVRLYKGNHFIIINLSPTPYDNYANIVVREKAEQFLKVIFEIND